MENPPAFLAITTTRLCINHSESSHSRHEICVGEWLREVPDSTADPTLCAERDEELRIAVAVLLEKLSPSERAVYILREAFDYPYRQIANILQIEEANTRQLVSRARKHLTDGRHTQVSSDEQRRLLEAFLGAAQEGDLAGLEDLFAEDVASHSHVGSVHAAGAPSSCNRFTVFVAALASHFWKGSDAGAS